MLILFVFLHFDIIPAYLEIKERKEDILVVRRDVMKTKTKTVVSSQSSESDADGWVEKSWGSH